MLCIVAAIDHTSCSANQTSSNEKPTADIVAPSSLADLHRELFNTAIGPWPIAKHKALAMTYGEVGFDGMQTIFNSLRDLDLLAAGGSFYDLGSGRGHGVLAAAALSHSIEGGWHSCKGIELNLELHTIATDAQRSWEAALDAREGIPRAKITLMHGDFLTHTWHDATAVFCVSTMFDEDLMQRISKRAELLSPGAAFVTVTHPLKSTKYRILHVLKLRMSWNKPSKLSYIFIHQRLASGSHRPNNEGS